MSINANENSVLNRRQAMLGIGAMGAMAGIGNAGGSRVVGASLLTSDELGWNEQTLEYDLPPLPYPADALEPHIDAQTMTIHHDKHHAGYVKGLNNALKQLFEIRAGNGDASLISHWSKQVSFHGSGHVNHTLFWHGMAPAGKGGGGMPEGKLLAQIERDFSSYEQFVAQFKAASGSVEGSGWGWLVWEPVARQLLVLQMENQQKLLVTGSVPIIGVDVWEHAYYLKYQNRRADYIDAFMNVVNWSWASKRFEAANS